MNQKIKLFCFIFLFFLGCSTKDSSKINRIEILFGPFSSNIFEMVNCYNFDSYFPVVRDVNSILVNDVDYLKNLEGYINKLKPNKNIDIFNGPDVRVKIIIYRENNVVDYMCLDGFGGITYNNQVMKNNNEITGLILPRIILQMEYVDCYWEKM
jgi:hypothetical protein